jgi:hypothetical protein
MFAKCGIEWSAHEVDTAYPIIQLLIKFRGPVPAVVDISATAKVYARSLSWPYFRCQGPSTT